MCLTLMITALNDANTQRRAMLAGADAFLTKPLDRAELCRCVATQLGRAS